MKELIERAPSLAVALEWNPPIAGPSLWRTITKSFTVSRIDELAPGRTVPVDSIGEIRRRPTNLWLLWKVA
jgi:hypothetical protein